MRATPFLPRNSFTLSEAVSGSPVLAHLGNLVEQSKRYMSIVEPIFPKALRAQIMPGPVGEGAWCLLVRNGATASKLRQLQPDLEARLHSKLGQTVKIRVKILGA
jgi:Dna[CI] antecedent, DciA